MAPMRCHILRMVTSYYPAFLLTALLIELTPGPNMAWLALTSVSEGKRAGLAAVAGIAVGLALLGAVSALGLAQIALAFPLVFDLLRYAGVAYLFWLAWSTWRSGEENVPVAPQTGRQLWEWFRHGLLLNLLNPKAAVFFLAILPAYVAPSMPVMPQTAALSASYVAIATAVHVGIVLLAAQAHGWSTIGTRQRSVRRIFAVMLAAIAIWFLASTR